MHQRLRCSNAAGVNLVRRDSLADQVLPDALGALFGKQLVALMPPVAAQAVGVPNQGDFFKLFQCTDVADQLVEW